MNVVISSLQQENEALRNRVQSLESELTLSQTNSQAEQQVEPEIINLYKQQIDAMRQKIEQQQAMNHRLSIERDKLAKLAATSSVHNQMMDTSEFVPNRWKKAMEENLLMESERTQMMYKIIQFSVNELSSLNEKIQIMQKQVLPTISREMVSKILNNQETNLSKSKMLDSSLMNSQHPTKQSSFEKSQRDNSSICREEYVLVRDQVEKIENNLYVLDVVTKAKMESLTLVKQKLRTQIADLKTEYNMHLSEKKRGVCEMEKTEREHAEEKERVRDKLSHLQALYETQRQQLTEELNRKNQALEEQVERIEQIMKESADILKQRERMEEEKQSLEKRLSEEEVARIQLASELSEQRRLYEASKEELSILKLSQKFLTGTNLISGVEDVGNIPQEKINLMKLVNQLMDENAKLKQDNVNLDIEVKRVKSFIPNLPSLKDPPKTANQLLLERRQKSFVPITSDEMKQHEISMVAEDRLSVDVLTSKLLADMLK